MEMHRKLRFAFLTAVCTYFMALMTVFSMAQTTSPAHRHKVKITGPIVVRDGDVVAILNGKDGSVHAFRVTDETTIRCDKGFLHGSTVMHASTLVPALTVEVEGIGAPEGMAEAKTIKFDPDSFAFTPLRDQQSRDLCRRASQDAGQFHQIRTLFSSLLPPI